MRSKQSQEGYLQIDNRASPGVSDSFVRRSGREAPSVHEGKHFESATVTCSHCQRVVILNPERSRERHYCRGCDHYICDTCANVPGCLPYNKMLDIMQEAQLKTQARGDPLGTEKAISDLRRDILG